MSSVHSRAYRRLLERLKQAREEAGISQRQAAKAFGKAQPFISKCESGERRIDPVELLRFSRLYGKPLLFFLPDDE